MPAPVLRSLDAEDDPCPRPRLLREAACRSVTRCRSSHIRWLSSPLRRQHVATFGTFSWAYQDEWRGNRIAKAQFFRVLGKTDTPARILYLATSADVVEQIEMVAAEVGRSCQREEVRPNHKDDFNHRLYFPDGAGPAIKRAVELLQDVLSIRVTNLDIMLALDWYKIPPSEDYKYWRDTELGDLRSRAKYYGSEACRDELVARMCAAAERHEIYRTCDAVLAVPGHDASKTSFSEELAADVAEELGRPLVKIHCRTPLRPQAKDEHVDFSDEFYVVDDLSDRSVMIVDDTIQSGNTIRHAAAAARDSGAGRVLGLSPVRNMKGS